MNFSLNRAFVASVFVGLSLGIAQSAAAGGTFYLCDMNNGSANGWISRQVGIVFDNSGPVTVVDNVTQHFVGGPQTARASKRGDVVRVTWNIANPEDSRGQRLATMRYSANLNTKTRKVAIVAKPVGLPQRWSSKGTCKARTK